MYKFEDLIEEVKEFNTDLRYGLDDIVGVTIEKGLIPTIANLTQTALDKFYIIKPETFVYNPRTHGVRLGMGYNDTCNTYITTWNNVAFRVKDTAKNIVIPQYLWLYFCRPVWDRLTNFLAWGSSTIVFAWKDFLTIEIDLPSITRQREIVAEYETLTRRIRINEQMIQNLESTAQTLYRKMFVDGIDKENLPEGWRMGTISDLVEIIDGDRGVNYPKDTDLYPTGFCLFLNAGNVTSKGFNFENKLYITEKKSDSMRAGKLKRNDIVFTTRGTVGNFALYSNDIPFEHMRINSGMVILRSEIIDSMQYIYHLFHLVSFKQEIINYLSGSAQPQLPIKDFNRIPIVIPSNDKIKMFSDNSVIINKNIDLLKNENYKLTELQSLLLAKMGQ